MRFNVDRICELAGLGAASGGLISEAAAPVPPAAGAKPAAPAIKTTPPPPAAKKPAMEMDHMYEEDEDPEEEGYMYEKDEDPEEEGYGMHEMGAHSIDNESMYEIDEMELAEALVAMRQQRLEESTIRDAVRDEIKRALSDRSGNWIYGSNRPTASRVGQVTRGGFGFGFKK